MEKKYEQFESRNPRIRNPNRLINGFEMPSNLATDNLSDILRYLGLTPKYCGYHYIIAAVNLIQKDPERLAAIVKSVYMEIGQQQNRPWYTIERNIRYAASCAWELNPGLLQQLCGTTLLKPPSNGEFLLALYYTIAQ